MDGWMDALVVVWFGKNTDGVLKSFTFMRLL
jgi:hypothetical protein